MMSKKPKIASMVECPHCERASHVLLKLTDKPKFKVVPCLYCKRDMLVGYKAEMSMSVEVSVMPSGQRFDAVALRSEVPKPVVSDPSVPRAFGLTWHRGALVDGGDDAL
jgi:hypothetical protein